MSDIHKNFVKSTVATAPSPATSGTNIVPASLTDFPDPATEGPYRIVVKASGAVPTSANSEICIVTAKPSGTSLTITRAQEGSSARTIIVGDDIYMAPTAFVFDRVGGANIHKQTQTAHGFSLFDVVFHSGTIFPTWAKGFYSNELHATMGMLQVVVGVPNADNFYLCGSGRVVITGHGLTVGARYYLSETTVGALTTTRTTVDPILEVDSADSVIIYPFSKGDGAMNLCEQLIVNGGFDIWQEGTSFTPNDDTYVADVWNALVETNGSWTFARDAMTDSDGGSRYFMKCSNVTANNQCALVYFIEASDAVKLNGKNVSISLRAKTVSSEITQIRAAVLSWTGTADSITSDVIGTWGQNGTEPTWATNWTREGSIVDINLTNILATYRGHNIAINTGSVNNVAVVIWVDDGTITSGDDFWVGMVQVNEGDYAFNFKTPLFSQELGKVQRFLETSYPYGTVPGTGAANSGIVATASSSQLYIPVHFRTSKVKVPTMTIYSSNNGTSGAFWDFNAGADDSSNVSTFYASTEYAVLANTTVTDQRNYGIQFKADARL